MAAVIGALRAELSATIARFQEDMKNAGAAVRDFATKAEAQGKRIQRIGQTMSLAITAPLVAFGVKSVQAAKESAQALGQVDAALKSTEHQAGRTIGQLQAAAKSLESISTFDDDDILRDVTTNLLKFGNVVGETFDKAQAAIVNMAARTGDLGSATQAIGRALNDPIQGINALTRAGVQFTNQEKEQIKTLVTSGRGVQAQAIILEKLERAYGGAAKALRDATPTAALNQQWRELTEVVGGILIDVLPPVIDLLKGIAAAFNAMSPEMQRITVYTGLFAAALGPLTVLLGTMFRVAATLAPAVARLGVVFGLLSAPVWAVVAAVTAAIAALVIFWKSVKGLLAGDFAGAWEDAKKTARDMWDDLKSMFASDPIQAPIELAIKGDASEFVREGKVNFSVPKDVDAKIKKLKDDFEDASITFHETTGKFAEQIIAERRLATATGRTDVVRGQEELADVHAMRGDQGLTTNEDRRRESIARDLEFRALEAEEKIADLQVQRAQAEALGYTHALESLDTQIAQQERLKALLNETSVDQVRMVERLQDTFDGFFSDVTNEFQRMAKEGKFTFAGIREAIREMLFDAFVKPHIEQAGGILKTIVGAGLNAIGGQIGGWVGDILAPTATQAPNGDWIPGPGGFPEPHAAGGFVPPSEWGVVGERGPELVFGGKHGFQVFSNQDSRDMLSGGGQTIIQNWNIRTNDGNSFRRSERQITRESRRVLQGG